MPKNCSAHIPVSVNTRLGVGCPWWFNYPGPFLDVEFEFACLSG